MFTLHDSSSILTTVLSNCFRREKAHKIEALYTKNDIQNVCRILLSDFSLFNIY